MANNDSIKKTITVALTLCVVCSLVVASAAVLLKPAQVANKTIDRKSNILAAAGMLDTTQPIDVQFAKVQARVVDLRTGQFTDAVSAESFDQLKSAKDPQLSTALGDADMAKIGRREHYAVVYLVGDVSKPEVVILPVRGYGLWSTLKGFMALEGDLQTVRGFGFYDHAETPGLGGEVDNPKWKALWPGKSIYGTDGEVAISVIKGAVEPGSAGAEYKVDGLSGASLTSRGVHNLVQFWLGDNGFKPFLTNLRDGNAGA